MTNAADHQRRGSTRSIRQLRNALPRRCAEVMVALLHLTVNEAELTHDNICALTGLSRQTVNVALDELRAARLIKYKYRARGTLLTNVAVVIPTNPEPLAQSPGG